MPLKPIATVLALLALGGAAAILIAAARLRRQWVALLPLAPALVLLLALVAWLGSYILGFSAPHPYFNRVASVPGSTVIYYLGYSVLRENQQPVQTWTLIAIQGRTGKTLWQRTMPSGITAFTDGGASVYTVSYLSSSNASQIMAIDAATGAIRWQKALPDAFANQPPVITQDALFLGLSKPNAQIVALRLSDGVQLWSTSISEYAVDRLDLSATTDTLVARVDHPGATNPRFLQARRMTDGQLLWSASLQADGSLVAGADTVYELPLFGSLVARDAHTGVKLWQFGEYNDSFHSGAVSGDTLFVAMRHSGPLGDGQGHFTNLEKVYALDTTTGRLRWTFATQSGNAGTVAASRDTVYIQADDGIHTLRASDGAVRWHSDPHNNWTFDGFSARPAVVGSMLYVTGFQTFPSETLTPFGPQKGQDYLYAINEADGSADWAVALGPVVTIQPHFVF
jgi:outer membrane protein assembly factor BamB